MLWQAVPARILALLLVGVSLGCDQENGKPPDKAHTDLAQWAPDAAMLDKLGAEAEVDEYRLRPPKGYSRIVPGGAPPQAKIVAWVGMRRSDRSAPVIQVMIGNLPPQERAPTVERALSIALASTRQRRRNWSETELERGMLNGMTFLRARWSGNERITGRKMHGVVYTAIDGKKLVQLQFQDAEPHHLQTLKVAEAAALTIKKK